MLRVFLGSSSRPQIAPQQYSVTSSCRGRLNSSAVLKALSTNSLPSTELRIARPRSKVFLSMSVVLSCLGVLPCLLLPGIAADQDRDNRAPSMPTSLCASNRSIDASIAPVVFSPNAYSDADSTL